MITVRLQVKDAAGQWGTLNTRRVEASDERAARAELATLRDRWESSRQFDGQSMRIITGDGEEAVTRPAPAPADEFEVIDENDDRIGFFPTLAQARAAVARKQLPAYEIWRGKRIRDDDGHEFVSGIRVERCDEHRFIRDDRVRQALGLPNASEA